MNTISSDTAKERQFVCKPSLVTLCNQNNFNYQLTCDFLELIERSRRFPKRRRNNVLSSPLMEHTFTSQTRNRFHHHLTVRHIRPEEKSQCQGEEEQCPLGEFHWFIFSHCCKLASSDSYSPADVW